MWYQDALDAAMKTGMRELASGVAVLACSETVDDKIVRHAMTVTSLTSLSDKPPSLLVCVHNETRCNAVLELGVNFSINVLNQNQESISTLCAFSPDNESRFAEGDWNLSQKNSVPYLADGVSSFICKVTRRHFYGTHHIVVGDIEQVYMNDHPEKPLLYVHGGYAKLPE